MNNSKYDNAPFNEKIRKIKVFATLEGEFIWEVNKNSSEEDIEDWVKEEFIGYRGLTGEVVSIDNIKFL